MNKMTNNTTPINLNHVSIFYNDRAALDNLNLGFRAGELTAVIGGSGSGKSLVLKCAAGLIFPDEGQVEFEGINIASMGETVYQKMQSRTGFYFQDAALWANKTLGENLSLPLLSANKDLTDNDIRDKIAESFASVGLSIDPSLRPASIPMGQRKLVSFLRATITGPEILFLDAPLAFLDYTGSRQILSKIEEFKDAGVTIITATHNRTLIDDMSDRIAVLSFGKLAVAGSYQELVDSRDPSLMPLLQELM